MGATDGLGYRDSLAHSLVLAHRFTISLTRAVEDALGITASNPVVLTLVLLSRAGSMTQSELVAATGTPRSTMARVVNGLEESGLVARRRDHTDQRRVLLALTASGRRRMRRALSSLADLYEAEDVAVKDAIDRLDDISLGSEPRRPPDTRDATASMAAAGAAYVDDVTEALEPYRVSEVADRFALALLDLTEEMRPTQLGHELGMTSSGVSGLIARLEAEGLVNRGHHDPSDRRAVTVALTDRGRDVAGVQLDVFARHARDIFQAMAATAAPV